MKKAIKYIVLAIVVIFVVMVIKDISKNPIQKKEQTSDEIPINLDANAYSRISSEQLLNLLGEPKIGLMKIQKAHFKWKFILMT